MVNTPTVTFANAVTQVGMPQANLTSQLLGLGGGTADSYNRLSVDTPAVLLNNAGAGIEATVNKAAAGNDAAFAFKTGFSARALMGLLSSDDFSFKVSPDGLAFDGAIRIDCSSGRVEMPEPVVLPAMSAVPAPPPTGKIVLYARDRAGGGGLDVQRPSGRFFPLQPLFGMNRIATWAPSSGTTVNTNGMPRTAVGTVATPTLATNNLSTSMRRWRVTRAATADAAAEERSAGWVCWHGNDDGLGGFTYVNRLSLVTLQAIGMGFFGLYGSTAALATTLTLSAMVNCIGIGFQRGTHELAVGAERCLGCTDTRRSRGEFSGGEHDERSDPHASRRSEQQRDRRPGGREGQRGGGRGLARHRHSRSCATPEPAQLHEQRRHGGGGRLRLLSRLCGDGLLAKSTEPSLNRLSNSDRPDHFLLCGLQKECHLRVTHQNLCHACNPPYVPSTQAFI